MNENDVESESTGINSLPDGLEIAHFIGDSQRFFSAEVFSSILLLFASVSAVVWANSGLHDVYHHMLHLEIAFHFGHYHIEKSLVHWVNDGLMALFFFTVGLEIKREILIGELASFKQAMLPVVAAFGGMAIPGLIYLIFNLGKPTIVGWGIPVATDIAFSLGAIAIFGKKLPFGLRIFLAAFAIADDLGGVLIIALFYTQDLVFPFLVYSGAVVILLFFANALKLQWTPVYVILGIVLWFFVLGSGVHATIAGVLTAMFVPSRGKYPTDLFIEKVRDIINNLKYDEYSGGYWFSILMDHEQYSAVDTVEKACYDVKPPIQRMEHFLHPWVIFVIMPIFAFCNAGLTLGGMSVIKALTHPVTMGIMLGLFVGKPLGITVFSYIACRSGLASLPDGVTWSHILGAAMLGGIGFTISLFISGLSFTDPQILNYSKLGVLNGSIMSALGGIFFLYFKFVYFKKEK